MTYQFLLIILRHSYLFFFFFFFFSFSEGLLEAFLFDSCFRFYNNLSEFSRSRILKI